LRVNIVEERATIGYKSANRGNSAGDFYIA
jgi:hypothetical protein